MQIGILLIEEINFKNQTIMSIGLALSGGGMKGIAHIGAIKALEESNIHPTHISGSSMGAIVGAFYASGYAPEEMVAFLKEVPLF